MTWLGLTSGKNITQVYVVFIAVLFSMDYIYNGNKTKIFGIQI